MSCDSKEQKETVMVLKVDLDCEKCYKKVKRVLCKFPQIRNQVYDKKNNTVIITVLCCSPEKIRDKLCCKADKSIKSIEIKQQSKPKAEPEKPKPTPDPVTLPLPELEKPKPAPEPQAEPAPKPAQPAPRPPTQPRAPAPAPVSQEPEAQWVPGYPPGPPPCCRPSPCCHTCPPVPPYPYGYCVRPCPPPYYGCRCDCFSEENPAACSVM